jgi:hypothetical protein
VSSQEQGLDALRKLARPDSTVDLQALLRGDVQGPPDAQANGGETLPPRTQPTVRNRRLHPSDVLLPIAVALWGLGVSEVHVGSLGQFGLPPLLPIVLYSGIGLLVISATCELARADASNWRMSLHAVAMVVCLYALAPIIYPAGRYEWLYKTIGPAQFISDYGQLDRSIDIYQNWPGFFALVAWFDKVAGIASPLAYAKWAQLAFELAALPLLYLIYDALGLTTRQRWIAILLYSAANWIGQDYFSPQGLGTVLSLGIMAFAVRWLYQPAPPADPIDDGQPRRARQSGGRLVTSAAGRGFTAPILCALLLCFFVLSFTHELSPYMVAMQLGTVAAVRYIRPVWVPAALAAVAVAYLAPRFAFVNSHFGVLSSIGNFFSNATPPSFTATVVPVGQKFIERCAGALSVGMWCMAALAAWRSRRSKRLVLTLVLLAYSPGIMLALQAYGQEGILRVYLFSLPWSAALVSLVIAPAAATRLPARWPRAAALAAAITGALRRGASALRIPRHALAPVLRAPLALGMSLALFFPAFFGDDSFNVIPAAQVETITSFWNHASPGPVYLAINDAPVADTARYPQFPLHVIFGSLGILGSARITRNAASQLAAAAASTPSSERVYVMITSSMEAYTEAYGIASAADFATLKRSLADSPLWLLTVHKPGVLIYQLLAPTHG